MKSRLGRLKRGLLRAVGRARLQRRGVRVGESVSVRGPLRVKLVPGAAIAVGDRVSFNALPRLNTLEARGPVILSACAPGARITVGDDSGMTSATISAAVEVAIGDRVLVGAGCLITDSDHHVVRPSPGVARRFAGLPPGREKDRVVIGDDVFLGARSIILKGVTIGAGAVVGAGSVVTRDVGAGQIVAGNPAVIVGSAIALES